jgi:hypothetical protein
MSPEKASSKKSGFPRKVQRDGSYSSICLNCFQTIGQDATEAELAAREEKHICEYLVVLVPGIFRPAL